MLETILQSGSVNRDIFVSVAGMLIGTAILAFTKPSLPRSLWARLKARYFSMRKGDALGVIVCDLRGDDNRSISYLILSHLRRNYVRPIGANGEEGKPLVAAKFPLSLQGTGDTDLDERRIEQRALRWLAKADADIIIWGDHTKSGNINTINILGLRSKDKVHAKIDVNFNDGALNELIAEVVTREVAAISTDAFSEPSKYDLATLRGILTNTETLLGSSFPGFNASTELRIRESISTVFSEVCKRSSNFADWRAATENSYEIVVNLETEKYSPRWAAAVYNLLRYQTVSAWAGDCLDSLGYTIQSAKALSSDQTVFANQTNLSVTQRISILHYVMLSISGPTRLASFPLVVRLTGKRSGFEINDDHDKKNTSADFEVNRYSVQEFVNFIEKMEVEEYIKFFIVQEYIGSVLRFDTNINDFDYLVKFANELIRVDGPLLTVHSAWRSYAGVEILDKLISQTGFSKVLDTDRAIPIEYLMRTAASNIYHFSRKFPDKCTTRLAMLTLASRATTLCSIYSGDRFVFKAAEELWREVAELTANSFPHNVVTAQIIHCVDLNNWGASRSDLNALDKSIQISESLVMDPSLAASEKIHSGYVLAFALAAKATLARDTDVASAKHMAAKAKEVCRRCQNISFSDDDRTARQSFEAVNRLLEGITDTGLVEVTA